MGLLDQVIGGVLGQVLGGGRGNNQGGGGAMGGAMSPIMQALMMLLMSKGGGGLGDIFGGGGGSGGQRPMPRGGPDPRGGDGGDLGGFGQDPPGGGFDGGADRGGYGDRSNQRGGDYSDLSGMLDGPGGAQDRGQGAGQYARVDHDQSDAQVGLDGLIDRFQRGGMGDIMESWIGNGQNRPIQPNQLADALGPDTVDTLQSRTGLDRGSLLAQLAQALPEVIHGLTPQGRRPSVEDRRDW